MVNPSSVWEFQSTMQHIDSNILECVLEIRESYNPDAYSPKEVKTALSKHYLDIGDLCALLSPAAEPFLEEIATQAQKRVKSYFGNSINVFTPLYLSNHCASKCVYCGFQKGNKIKRAKLEYNEIKAELEIIAKSGLQEVLFLCGEGREYASVEYIAKACELAKQYFKVIGVEIYALNVDEYELLHKSGCDFVTLFQETYCPKKYARIHIEGEKRAFAYRFYAQERALQAGMRGVGFGALLGIDDFRKDALSCALHAYFLQRKYPHAEIALSIPRLRPIINNPKIHPKAVTESRLLQVLCAYRLFLPYASITISSREGARFRNNAIKLGANKISAGVSVAIGERSAEEKKSRGDDAEKKGDEQFSISDNRSVEEILSMLKIAHLQPVMSDSVFVG